MPRKLIFATLLLLVTSIAFGHPEDELCIPGQDGMDPALCAALAEMNSSEGSLSQDEYLPILDESGEERSFLSTVGLYIKIGIGHIVPDGADHILFVLAIFLASVRTRARIWQISAFTVAHTATLGLAASGVITPSTSVVEPLIAFTIAFVAIENLVFKDMTKWRPAVVFGFGLIHGLGFAGFFGELGCHRVSSGAPSSGLTSASKSGNSRSFSLPPCSAWGCDGYCGTRQELPGTAAMSSVPVQP